MNEKIIKKIVGWVSELLKDVEFEKTVVRVVKDRYQCYIFFAVKINGIYKMEYELAEEKIIDENIDVDDEINDKIADLLHDEGIEKTAEVIIIQNDNYEVFKSELMNKKYIDEDYAWRYKYLNTKMPKVLLENFKDIKQTII